MTTFVDPDLLNTAPLDPVSSELMTAMKLNPVAMGEGADGAQRIEPTATTRFAIPVGTLASPSVLIVPTGSLDAGMYFVYMSINAGGHWRGHRIPHNIGRRQQLDWLEHYSDGRR